MRRAPRATRTRCSGLCSRSRCLHKKGTLQPHALVEDGPDRLLHRREGLTLAVRRPALGGQAEEPVGQFLLESAAAFPALEMQTLDQQLDVPGPLHDA